MEGSEGERRKAECIIWTFVDGGLSNKGRRTRARQRDHLIISAPISRKQAPPSVVLCSRPTADRPRRSRPVMSAVTAMKCTSVRIGRTTIDERTNEREGAGLHASQESVIWIQIIRRPFL